MNSIRAGLIIAAMSTCLSGCDNSDYASAPTLMEELKSEWSTLDDGSSFARVNDVEREREIAMRCWPLKTTGYLCVSVVKSEVALGVTTVSRSLEKELPPMLWGLPGNGYRCENLMGKREEIAAVDDVLVSNKLSDTGRAWSASFVRDYMAKNKLDEPGYFRCLDILEAVTEGSPRTLGTTTITRALAG